ncbi:cytochrome P450 [Hymenopellis radicata]|nr:cytochrome P450 [Hymenopellis radicata]
MYLYLACLILIIVVSYVFYRLYLYPRYFSPLRSIPGPPLGSVIASQFGREWVKSHGPVVRVVGPVGVERVIFTSQEALSKILVNSVDYPRPDFMRNLLGSVSGFGLLTHEGKEHRQMRRAMNPAFGLQHLIAQVDMYYDSIESLLDILGSQIDAQVKPEDGKVFLMYEWVGKVTLDIICLTAFGYITNSLHNPHNELAEAYEGLISLNSGQNLAIGIAIHALPGATRLFGSEWMYRHRWILRQIPLLRFTEIVVDRVHRIKDVSAKLLAEKLHDASTVSDIDSKKDVMSILVRARMSGGGKDSDGYVMSDQAMMDQVLTFLGAGHETTASAVSWTLWLLASNPEAQTKLRREVMPVFEQFDGRPDYKALKDMQWLDAVVMESLRILPPVPMTVRCANKTDYIDGALIPKGTLFYIPIRVVNTLTTIWGEDAEQFNPMRWMDPEMAGKGRMLTFLEGPHGCMGKAMAVMEMKAIVGALISKFEFSPGVEGQVAIPTAAVSMSAFNCIRVVPKDSMPLRVRRVL